MDPIADMLIRIKNAQAVGLPTVGVPYSKYKISLAKLFKKEGLVDDVVSQGRKTRKIIEIDLKYKGDGKGAIEQLQKISKPSRRVYLKRSELGKLAKERGFAVLSTSGGLMTSKEAIKKNLGGEYICKII